jgi:hypothetical protein
MHTNSALPTRYATTTSFRALTHVASRCPAPRKRPREKRHELAFENGATSRRASRLHERRPHHPATASATATREPAPNSTPNVFLEPRNRLPAPQPFAANHPLQDRYRLAGSAMRNRLSARRWGERRVGDCISSTGRHPVSPWRPADRTLAGTVRAPSSRCRRPRAAPAPLGSASSRVASKD